MGNDILLGGIVLPEVSSEEEKFAVYELQYYIWKMTGKVLGLAGRDEIFDGSKVLIGRVIDPDVLHKLELCHSDLSHFLSGKMG